VAASVSVVSDYQVQGLSLSDGRPVLEASLAYDRPGGVYGGATALAVFGPRGPRPLGYVAYLGYSGRVTANSSWDVGVSNSEISQILDKRYSDNYTEIYIGGTKGNVSAHLYVSPDYVGGEGPSLYLEVSGAAPLARHWRLFGHAGVLTGLGNGYSYSGARTRADVRAGLAREFRNFELRAAVTAVTPTPVYPRGYRQARQRAVFEAVAFF